MAEATSRGFEGGPNRQLFTIIISSINVYNVYEILSNNPIISEDDHVGYILHINSMCIFVRLQKRYDQRRPFSEPVWSCALARTAARHGATDGPL